MIPYGSVSSTITRSANNTEGTCEHRAGQKRAAKVRSGDTRTLQGETRKCSSGGRLPNSRRIPPHLRAKGCSPLGHSWTLSANGPRTTRGRAQGRSLGVRRRGCDGTDFEGHSAGMFHPRADACGPRAPGSAPACGRSEALEAALRGRRACGGSVAPPRVDDMGRPVRQSLHSASPNYNCAQTAAQTRVPEAGPKGSWIKVPWA